MIRPHSATPRAKAFSGEDLMLPAALAANPRLRASSLEGTVLALMVRRRFKRLAELPPVSADIRPTPPTRAFERALAAPGRRFIFEVKTASPSEGVMNPDFAPQDLRRLASLLDRFADAVSVLVEPDFFGGSFERLAQVRALVGKPILAKDIVVDERQILAAKRAGADAVLLMLSVLSDEGFAELARFAASLGLDVICEAHDEAELTSAARLGARVIGVNNRNLRTLETDVANTIRLAPRIPADRVFVSESGFLAREDPLEVEAGCGAARLPDAYLIGSALSKAEDPSAALRELVFGRVKVCGITRAEDARDAAATGALAVGIILAKRSTRAVPLESAPLLAAEIRRDAAAMGLPLQVAAVLDAEEAQLPAFLEALRRMNPDVVELHGRLDPTLSASLRRALPSAELRAALAGNGPNLERTAAALLASGDAESVLLDASAPTAAGGRTGGAGVRFDHRALGRFASLGRIAVAGGLNDRNVGELARRLPAPMEIDVNSGVESAPGIKSRTKLLAFFETLRRGERAPSPTQTPPIHRHSNAQP